MISMKKTLNITKYVLSILKLQAIITLSVLLLNVLIGLIISLTQGGEAGGGSIDMVALIWGVIYGLLIFSFSFKFALVNGTSRKSCFVGCLIALVIISFAVSVMTSIIAAICNGRVKVLNLYHVVYGSNVFGLFVWEFFAMLMCAALGFLIAALNYRLILKVKLIAIGGLTVLSALFVLINVLSHGGFLRAVVRFFKAVLGMSFASPNPFIASLFFIGLTVLFCGLVFLIMKRAGIRR